MKISEVMHQGCKYCGTSDSVAEAAKLMASEDVGVVPIAENDKMVGMLTDRDIVIRGVAAGRDISGSPVKEFMSDHVYYCFDDQEVDEVANNMSQMQVRRMPVVNRDKRLVGIVSLGDLANKAPEQAASNVLHGVTHP